jgi:hypothetical protein
MTLVLFGVQNWKRATANKLPSYFFASIMSLPSESANIDLLLSSSLSGHLPPSGLAPPLSRELVFDDPPTSSSKDEREPLNPSSAFSERTGGCVPGDGVIAPPSAPSTASHSPSTANHSPRTARAITPRPSLATEPPATPTAATPIATATPPARPATATSGLPAPVATGTGAPCQAINNESKNIYFNLSLQPAHDLSSRPLRTTPKCKDGTFKRTHSDRETVPSMDPVALIPPYLEVIAPSEHHGSSHAPSDSVAVVGVDRTLPSAGDRPAPAVTADHPAATDDRTTIVDPTVLDLAVIPDDPPVTVHEPANPSESSPKTPRGPRREVFRLTGRETPILIPALACFALITLILIIWLVILTATVANTRANDEALSGALAASEARCRSLHTEILLQQAEFASSLAALQQNSSAVAAQLLRLSADSAALHSATAQPSAALQHNTSALAADAPTARTKLDAHDAAISVLQSSSATTAEVGQLRAELATLRSSVNSSSSTLDRDVAVARLAISDLVAAVAALAAVANTSSATDARLAEDLSAAQLNATRLSADFETLNASATGTAEELARLSVATSDTRATAAAAAAGVEALREEAQGNATFFAAGLVRERGVSAAGLSALAEVVRSDLATAVSQVSLSVAAVGANATAAVERLAASVTVALAERWCAGGLPIGHSLALPATAPEPCPATTGMATTVAVNVAAPLTTALVAHQSDASATKETAFFNPVTGAAQLPAGPRTFTSRSHGDRWMPCAFVGPVAVCGLPDEGYKRNAITGGAEDATPTSGVGGAILHTGVAVGVDGTTQAAATTVLANPVGASGHAYGVAVAIAEVSRGAEYHVLIGTWGEYQVHVLKVVKTGVFGWVVPAVTALGTLAKPWEWSSISSLAAGWRADGRPVVVVGTPFDDRCGPTAAFGAKCLSSGAAHVFVLGTSGGGVGGWEWNGTLKPPVVKNGAQCGWSVAVAAGVAAVGCYLDPSLSSGVDFGEARADGSNVGSAHVWRLDNANTAASVREAYLKAFRAVDGQYFGQAVAVAANITHELIAVSADRGTGAPYGIAITASGGGLGMPYDVAVNHNGQPSEGEVWTFVHRVGAGVGTWRAAQRVKPPRGLAEERFGWTLSAAATPAGPVVLGVGTRAGCTGYLVVLS